MAYKPWGKSKFWGVGGEFDPDWNYDEKQVQLRDKLIEICRTKIRPCAVKNDETYEYPKESLKALAELGLLGLIIPKEFGGLGQSHVCIVMILEALARYGCSSTAMIYAMHIQATAVLLMRYHNNEEIKKLLRRICCEGLVGSTAYSDPATGGHFWFPLSSKSQKVDDEHYKVFRFNSWTTSAGFADFYIFQTPTPGDGITTGGGLTTFFVFKDEIRASTDNWKALGLHANQSGPIIFEGVLHKSRIVGNPGKGQESNNKTGVVFFIICTTSVWNGIAFGCIDLARKHTMQKTHGDTGMRVADYPIIQDYVGRSICETNACRTFILSLASHLDNLTNQNDWRLHENPFLPRSELFLWLMQAKHNAAENVSRVSDQMLKACGGEGYKADLGLERLLRDSKAGCVMAPSNELIRNLIGRRSLRGFETFDSCGKEFNYRTVRNELNKMSLEEKEEILNLLTEDINREQKGITPEVSYQDTDFDNPFNLGPPTCIKKFKTPYGVERNSALSSTEWTNLVLESKENINDTMVNFLFTFPNPNDHSGCLPGQYIQIRLKCEGKYHERFFSPVSPPKIFGFIELVLKLETNGIVSNCLQKLQIGDKVEFRGPCGGFEYVSNGLDELTILASGSGVAPGLQLIRSVVLNPEDKTKITLIYYSTNAEEIVYKEELEELNRIDDRIRIIVTVLEAPENWNHEEGFLNQEIIEKFITRKNGKKHKILLCGGSMMTISCLHSLRSLRFSSEQIFVYGPFGTDQIKAVFGPNAKLSGHTISIENIL